jgi:hypothetical protein
MATYVEIMDKMLREEDKLDRAFEPNEEDV